MTSIIHTKNSVYEIDYDESLFRRVWSNNEVLLTGDIWFPFDKAEQFTYPGGTVVMRFDTPAGPVLTSRILT